MEYVWEGGGEMNEVQAGRELKYITQRKKSTSHSR